MDPQPSPAPGLRYVDGLGAAWHHLPEDHEQAPPPLRPVRPPEPDSIAALFVTVRHLLEQSARRHLLIGALCVALDDVAQIAGTAFPLTVGLPGQAEARAIAAMAYLHGPELSRDPARYDHRTRLALTDIVLDWITAPTRYVDPAEALPALLAAPVHLVGGWPAVADEGLRRSDHADLLARFVTPPSAPLAVTRLGVWTLTHRLLEVPA